MSCGNWATLLGFVGGFVGILPSLHAGYLGMKANKYVPEPSDRGAFGQILQGAFGYIERATKSFRQGHFYVMLCGVVFFVASFAVDFFLCA